MRKVCVGIIIYCFWFCLDLYLPVIQSIKGSDTVSLKEMIIFSESEFEHESQSLAVTWQQKFVFVKLMHFILGLAQYVCVLFELCNRKKKNIVDVVENWWCMLESF